MEVPEEIDGKTMYQILNMFVYDELEFWNMFLLICLGFTLKPNKQVFFVLIPFFFLFQPTSNFRQKKDLKKIV